jgi:predicted component of type VI protein secretion system
MAYITLRVIDGADRGRVYERLQPPITIGREEGNSIQLNDERISRFHVKIQEDHDNLVLTDLESTNGTKVNGEDIQLRILRLGDVVSVGRSVMLYGSREEIAERLDELRRNSVDDGTMTPEEYRSRYPDSALDLELNWRERDEIRNTLHANEPPILPQRLSPGQAAQVSEILEYFHLRIRSLIAESQPEKKSGKMTIEPQRWQELLDMQARLAEYLRAIGDPEQGVM